MKEYSPIELPNDKCYEYQNTSILRIYDSINLNEENTFTDYDVTTHYTKFSGKVFLDHEPNCINHNDLSNDFYYRNDLSHILFIFLVFAIVIVYLPIRLILRFYKRGKL